MIKLTLPWPPSANHYLGRNGNRSYLKKEAILYHQKVAYLIAKNRLNRCISDMRMHVVYRLWFPDDRRRDCFNCEKVLSDSLTRCRFWKDDKDIWHGEVIRMGVDKDNPRVEVEVSEHER